MKKSSITLKALIGMVALLTLTACGGSSGGDDDSSDSTSYSGKTSAATVTSSNYGAMAKTGSYGSEEAITSSETSASTARSYEESIISKTLNLINAQKSLASRDTTYTDEICDGGGSVTISDSSSSSYTITYNSCVISDVTYDGTVYFESLSNGGYQWTYDDFTVTYNGETYTLNTTITCDSSYNCTYSEDFSRDGVSYQVSDAEVSGSSSAGWDVSAKIYHEDYGYITITATDLMMCDDGGFSSGSISITDSTDSEVISISFSDSSCSTMTVTYEGVSETVSQ